MAPRLLAVNHLRGGACSWRNVEHVSSLWRLRRLFGQIAAVLILT
jgi:hypothetical protein